MTAQTPPFALQNASHSAALFREAVSSLLAPTGGVIGPGDLLVGQHPTPNMSVDIAAGQVWIPGTSAPPGQAMYYGFNDALVNLAVAASNATNPRIDRVVATVDDSAYSGGANDWKLQIVTGTPTAGATLVTLTGAAAVPVNSLLLANVLVPATSTTVVTANVSDRRAFASSAGLALRANPAASLVVSAGQSIPQNTPTMVTNYNTLFLRGGVTFNGTGILTVPVTGIYQINGYLSMAFVTSVNNNQLYLQVNGSTQRTSITNNIAGNANFAGAINDLLPLNAGDTVNLQFYNSASGSIGVAAGSLSLALISL